MELSATPHSRSSFELAIGETLEVAILIWNEHNWIFSIAYMIFKNMSVKLSIGVENLIFLDVF